MTEREQAIEHFTKHELVYEHVDVDANIGVWRIRQPDARAFHLTVCASAGQLTCFGDVEPLTFAYGPSNPVQCVNWIGRCDDMDYYVPQKAVIGSEHDAVWRYDIATAEEQLRTYVADSESGLTVRQRVALRNFIHEYGVADTLEETVGVLIQCGVDDPPTDFGLVLSWRVWNCWAGVRRLAELLA